MAPVILVASVGVLHGTDRNVHVDMVGVGPVPREISETLMGHTEPAGMMFDWGGCRLWLDRNQRFANAAQRLAVAVRYGGCFECGAPMHHRERHHIREWHRDNGRTDVPNLVAICRKHHRWLETENLIAIRTPNGYEAGPRDGPGRYPPTQPVNPTPDHRHPTNNDAMAVSRTGHPHHFG